MGRVTDWLLARPTTVTEAATAPATAPAATARQGFEYGIPAGGLTEANQGLGAVTQTDRRSMLTQLYDSYLACTWAGACVDTIARTVTAGGLVTDWDRDDGEGDEEAPEKPAAVLALERLLAFVNPQENIRQLLRAVIADLLVFGDAFLEVVWVGKIPVALYNLDSPSMMIIADVHGQVTQYVQVTDQQQRAEFDPDQVIHISLDSPRSGLYGVSPTQKALLPITAWLFTAATLKEVYRKGNPPEVHADLPTSMQDTEIRRWAQQYASRNIGPRNIGNPRITKGGAKLVELQRSKIEELLHTKDQLRDEIISSYGVPPAEVSIIESGNLGGGTGESQRKSYLLNTCQPVAELVLEAFNYAVAKRGFDVEGWHLKFRDVDMRDSKVVEDIRDMRLRSGAYTLNRYRAEINEPPVDGGDTAVLVDRQNLVVWRDMVAYSHAGIAARLKGTDTEVANPDATDEEPVALQKAAPKPTSPALQPFAGKPPPDPNQPLPDDGGEESARYSGRPLRETWQQQYRTRLTRALAELPR